MIGSSSMSPTKNIHRHCLPLLAAFVGLWAASASAGVLYDNGADQQFNYYSIDNSFEVTNSFVLSSAASIYGVNLVVGVGSTDIPLGVDWLITTAAFGGTTEASGTAAFVNTTVSSIPSRFGGNLWAYSVEFDIPALPLAAGTYWLQLQNGTDAQSAGLSWAESSGPSSAQQTLAGSINSESFQILSPEPGGLILMGSGILALVLRRRSRA